MRRHRLLGWIGLLSMSPAAFAGIGEVKRIFPGSNGSINFQLKGDNCNAAYNYYYFDGSTSQGKNWYSLLLASAATGTPVAVRFVGDAAPCNPNVDKLIDYIYVDY